MTPARTLFYHFGEPLPLDSGAALPAFTLAYQTWGKLDATGSNAILVLHSLSGDAHLCGRHEDGRLGWWDRMAGPGLAIDTERYFVVCANFLGGCKGSTGPASPDPIIGQPYGATFPVLTLHDIARAQLRLLAALGLHRLHAVIGTSLGGMVALALVQLAPTLARRIVTFAAAPHNHAQAIAWNKIGRQAVMSDPAWQGGAYYGTAAGPPRHGLAIARMLGHVTYVSEAALDQKFGRRLQQGPDLSFSLGVDYAIESYLDYQGKLFHERFDANSYLYLTRALDYFDFAARTGGSLRAAFAEISARFCFFSYSADWLYSPARNAAMAAAARAAGREVSHVVIDAPLGHDSFLVQTEPQSTHLREFLSATTASTSLPALSPLAPEA